MSTFIFNSIINIIVVGKVWAQTQIKSLGTCKKINDIFFSHIIQKKFIYECVPKPFFICVCDQVSIFLFNVKIIV